jgi:hypothetical protein
MAAIDTLVKSFLQKESLEECSVLELQQLARNYPYSSAAQLLLAEKMKAASATGMEKQFERTSLYIHGPLWQDIFSTDKGDAIITPAKKETIATESAIVEETPMIPAMAASEEEEETGIPTFAASEEETVEETITVTEPAQEPALIITDEETTTDITTASTVEEPTEHSEDSTSEEMVEATIAAEPEVKFETTIPEVEKTEPDIDNEPPITIPAIEAALPAEEIIHEPIVEYPSGLPVEEEQVAEATIITEPVHGAQEPTHPDTPEYEEQPLVETGEEIVAAAGQPIIGTVIAGETDQSSEPMKTEDMHQQQPLPEVSGEIPGLKIEPIDPATAELSFTPYHTVDYFATQGIKFREEDQPRDKFGKQLKSFTEWLKVLKKVPGVTVNIAEGKQDKKVEQMAAHSVNNEGEVLTEAMAEVWEKQDNPQKAIEIYKKLSLLNPGKRAYFAAKIDQLKNS